MTRLTPEREAEIREYRRNFGMLEPGHGAELLNELDAVRAELETRTKLSPMMRLPDGSGAFVASFPLPKDHWLYTKGHNDPPMPMRVGNGPKRNELADQVREAARFAIRASTMNGKETDFDPDAMVQNMVVGLLGYWTDDGQ